MPLSAHIKENAKNFHRLDVVWTPTVLVLDAGGKERSRLEGYLSPDEFRAFLEMGLARVAFMKKDWAEAERRYGRVADEYPDSSFAPEAVYYRGVSRYSASHEGSELAAVARTLKGKYQDSVWAMKSDPWSSH